VALPKGGKLDTIIQKAVELGVTRITPIITERTEVRLNAVKKIAEQVRSGQLRPEEIDLPLLGSFLSTYPLPDPDLIIRTSGERRISNFLLYQSAYTELFYSNVLWPDFSDEDFLNAIIDFQGRERRFGMTQEQIVKA